MRKALGENLEEGCRLCNVRLFLFQPMLEVTEKASVRYKVTRPRYERLSSRIQVWIATIATKDKSEISSFRPLYTTFMI